MKRTTFWALSSVAIALAVPGQETPQLLSKAGSPSISAAGASFAPGFSPDGRFLVFLSHANNLVPDQPRSPWMKVFTRDLISSNTFLVSAGTNGLAANADASLPSISSNGSVVAFVSRASNLVPEDGNGADDVFIHDVTAGKTRLASVDRTGGSPADPDPFRNVPLSSNPILSHDGRWVFFESRATNLVERGAPAGSQNIYGRDLWSNLTVLVTADTNGLPLPGRTKLEAISDDGRWVSFISSNKALTGDTPNPGSDVYVRDTQSGVTIRASAGVSGDLPGGYVCSYPRLSGEGRYIAFMAADLSGSERLIIRYDRTTTQHLAIAPPSPAKVIDTGEPIDISADGATIVFEASHLYVHLWRECCGVMRVALCSATCGDDCCDYSDSRLPRLGRSGRYVAFANSVDDTIRIFDALANTNRLVRGKAAAINGLVMAPALPVTAFDSIDRTLVSGDGNGERDVFIDNPGEGRIDLVSVAATGTGTSAGIATATTGAMNVSADGRFVVFTRGDTTLDDDTNNCPDIYLADMQQNTVRRLTQGTNSYDTPIISADGRTILAAAYGDPSLSGMSARFGLSRATNGELGHEFTIMDDTLGSGPPGFLSPSLTADGRLFAFASLVALTPEYDGDTDMDVFVADTFTDITGSPRLTNYLVSRAVSSSSTGNAFSRDPTISFDGRWVAYTSLANNIVRRPVLPDHAVVSPTDVAGALFPYLAPQAVATEFAVGSNTLQRLDTRLCSYIIISNSSSYIWQGQTVWQTALAPLTNGTGKVILSGNGRYVAFPMTDGSAVWRHDLLGTRTNFYMVTNGSSTWITNNIEPGAENFRVASNGRNPSINYDGTVIAFERTRNGGTVTDVYVTDLRSGQEDLASVSLGGAAANGASFAPLVSADGRYVVFQSMASDLVNNDENGTGDVFVRDRMLGETILVSVGAGGRSGNGRSSRTILGPDGRTIVFQSFADDLVPGDFNDRRDLFLFKLGGSDTDGDGLDDDWEVAHFGNLSRDGAGDLDGDGIIDRDEFLAGTDPTDSGSIFRTFTLLQVGSPARRIFWMGEPSRSYRVEYKDDLNAQVWTRLDTPATWNGKTASVTDSSPAVTRFYRVIRVP